MDSVSREAWEAGSGYEHKLYLLKRPDVKQITLSTFKPSCWRFHVRKVQGIFLPLAMFGSVACRLRKICCPNLQHIVFSRFSLQLQKAGGYFRLEMDCKNSTSFRLWRVLALFRSFWPFTVQVILTYCDIFKPCMSHLAYANICSSSGQAHQPRIYPSLKWLLLAVSNFRLFTAESPRGGSMVALVHPCTPTLLHNVVKCVRKAYVSFQWPLFFSLKFSSIEVIQGGWANSELQWARFLTKLQLTLLKPHQNSQDWLQSTLCHI